MAIGNAVQRSSFVYVYDETRPPTLHAQRGRRTAGRTEGLYLFTVNIRRGAFIYTYNEKGRQISITPAR